MKIDILTLFPDMVRTGLETSILGRAQKNGAVTITAHQLRDWAIDKHRTVDDTPYGGGPGMLLKVDVIDNALTDLKKNTPKPYTVLLTPQGKRLNQSLVRKLAKKKHLIVIAGHYEGFDERVRTLADVEISLGDFVLTGGELPAMVLTDAVVRLLPGVLGDADSAADESFSENLLEYPQFTRPERFLPRSKPRKQPLTVPSILLSGNHAHIRAWRTEQAQKKTQRRRPDLG